MKQTMASHNSSELPCLDALPASSRKLAIFGGTPIQEKAYDFIVPGATMIGKEEEEQVLEVVRAGSLFRHPGYNPKFLGKVNAFEKEFAARIGAKYALAVSSGTAALRVGLAALGIGPGDEVILPAWTFIASATAVVINRGIPVLAEVDRSLNLDPDDFERKITPRTKAVMTVPILGVCGHMDRIVAIARKHNLKIIEDVASSCGASFGGKCCGTFGDLGCFSLQMAKVITAGDGGVVVTNNKDLYIRAVRYHDQGYFRTDETQGTPFIGENYRMPELSGAVALAQIRKLDTIIRRMRALKKIVKDGIRQLDKEYGAIEFREVPDEAGDVGQMVFMFFKTPAITQRFIEALSAENVGHPGHARSTVHVQWPWLGAMKTHTPDGCPFTCPHYKGKVDLRPDVCPKTEALTARGVSLCLSPVFTEDDAHRIVLGVRKVLPYALTGKES